MATGQRARLKGEMEGNIQQELRKKRGDTNDSLKVMALGRLKKKDTLMKLEC